MILDKRSSNLINTDQIFLKILRLEKSSFSLSDQEMRLDVFH